MKENVLIITRRFKEHTGIGTEPECCRHELTTEAECELFKIIRNSLRKRFDLIMKKHLDDNDADVETYKELNRDELEEMFQSSSQSFKDTSISDAFNQKTNIKTLRFFLKKQDSQNLTHNSFSKQDTENTTPETDKYFYLLNILEPITNVFVFAHWPSELYIGRQEFLEALRKDVTNILIKKIKKIKKKTEADGSATIEIGTIENRYCFNWLVHDSDILPSDYDGILQYDRKIIYQPAQKYISPALKEDNIWCFIHNTDTSDSYKNLIIDYKKTFDDNIRNSNLTANSFIDALLADGCKRRMNLLGIKEITEQTASEQLYFIFQRPVEEATIGLYKKLIELEKNMTANGNGN